MIYSEYLVTMDCLYRQKKMYWSITNENDQTGVALVVLCVCVCVITAGWMSPLLWPSSSSSRLMSSIQPSWSVLIVNVFLIAWFAVLTSVFVEGDDADPEYKALLGCVWIFWASCSQMPHVWHNLCLDTNMKNVPCVSIGSVLFLMWVVV